MEVLSLTEARNNLSEVFDRVYHDHEEIIIHRKARESVVVIPLSEYESEKESRYLLKSPNKEHILKSLEELKSGKTVEMDLIE